MEINVKELQQKADYYNNILSKRERRYIYLASVQNFLKFVDQFESQDLKIEILHILKDYFLNLDEDRFLFNSDEQREILFTIIHPIAKHYEKTFSFKQHHNVKILLFIGIHIDLFMLIIGWLKNFYYIPIFTLLFTLHWTYIEIFFARKSKVY